MTIRRLSGLKTLAVAITIGISSHAMAATITGAGSTFIYPALSKWTMQYKKETGNEINYQAIGSGGGLRQLAKRTVDFAASDKPLTATELKKNGYVQFPAISGGIVLAYHLPIKKTLTLNGKTAAAIFNGKIKYWNNPEIAKLNPDITLPHLPVIAVHRSDGSGTTYNFTYYLSQVAPKIWTSGSGTVVSWPGAALGGKGNAGVANYIKQITGSIGYVEYAYAKDNGIKSSDMINASGNKVSPSLTAFQASSKNANWQALNGYNLILANAPGKDSWPMAASTFVLVRKSDNPAAIKATTKFFSWVFNSRKAQQDAANLDYVALPKNLVSKVEKTMSMQLNTSQLATK